MKDDTKDRVRSIVDDHITYDVPEDIAAGAGPLNHHEVGKTRLTCRYFNGREVTGEIKVTGKNLSHCEWHLVVVETFHPESNRGWTSGWRTGWSTTATCRPSATPSRTSSGWSSRRTESNRTEVHPMSIEASDDTDASSDDQQFEGEYNAFGAMGRTTSNPSTLVWLEDHEHTKFGLHHPGQYGVAEVFGWLVNNVRSVPLASVEDDALANGLRLAIKGAPEQEPSYVAAADVEGWG